MMLNKIVLIMLLVNICSVAYGQVVDDTIAGKELSEVVVKAQRIIPKGDHQLLLLSKENREFGTNALDAVSSLQLFKTSLNETALQSADRQEVYILINGIPATGFELRGFKGEDIKNVEYYPVAPPQYMTLASGPVVNIVMKKRHDRLYTAYVNTLNAVNTGFGTNQLTASYTDSLNQVRVGYLADYRNISDLRVRSEYDYGAGRHTWYDGRSKYAGIYQRIDFAYQRFQGRHLFNSKLSYVPEHGDDNMNGTAAVSDVGQTVDGLHGKRLKSHVKSFTADIYYNYMFRNGGNLAVNVVNAFGRSDSRTRLWMDMPASYDGENYDLSSGVDNKTYSLIANVVYVSRVWGGTFQTGNRYEYNRLLQSSGGENYRPESHNNFTYAGIYWMKDGKTIFPSVGLNVIRRKSVLQNETSVIPYFRLYSDIWFQGRLQGLTIQLTMQMNPRLAGMGDLTESSTFIDRWFVNAGNPGLNTAWRTFGSLVLAYFQPGQRNNIALKISPSYTHAGIAPVIGRSANGEYAVLQMQNIGNVWYSEATVFGSWYPWKWMEISPYVELYLNRYDTPFRSERSSYFRAGGSITVSHGNFTAMLAANSRTKEFQGDLQTGGSAQYAASVQYKYRDWSFGLSYNYLGDNDYTHGAGPGFSYCERKDWQPLKKLFRIAVTYSFSKGKARQHGQKIIQESSREDGLTKVNKARGPEQQ